MITEIYFGIKNREYEIEETPNIFGKKVKATSEKGLSLSLDQVKPEMKYHIEIAKTNKPTSPFLIDDKYAIIEVLEYHQKLDEELRERIIKEQFDKFIFYGVEELMSLICTYKIMRLSDRMKVSRLKNESTKSSFRCDSEEQPFAGLSEDSKCLIRESAEVRYFTVGERLTRSDELNASIYPT